jgi:hypothetical protein
MFFDSSRSSAAAPANGRPERDVLHRRRQHLVRKRAVHTLHEDNPGAVLAVLKDFLGF